MRVFAKRFFVVLFVCLPGVAFSPVGKAYLASGHYAERAGSALQLNLRQMADGQEPGGKMAVILLGGLFVWILYTYATWDKQVGDGVEMSTEE